MTLSNSVRCFVVIVIACFLIGAVFSLRADKPADHVSVVSPNGPQEMRSVGGAPLVQTTGNAVRGKEVFRFETFGNEGFWTDAMRMPLGMKQHETTPLDLLKIGLVIDIDAVPADLREKLTNESKTDLSPQSAPIFNNVQTTARLIDANAIVGVVAKGKGRVGVACAICHTLSDNSVYEMKNGGSIGHRIDGPANLNLNVGKLLATAANSRAYYPNLQLRLGGKTIGRAPTGITEDSTEEEVDAYLSNPKFYPIGTFDETQDGIGNSVTNQPLFRQDLAAPYGSAGEFAHLEDIANGSYTTNLDPTTLLSPEGRQFLKMKAGALGVELADNYAKILKDTGVTGYPFVKAAKTGKVDDPSSPVGLRVANEELLDMNAYLVALPAPKGAVIDDATFARGRALFSSNKCDRCHNADQGIPVPTNLVDLKMLWPGYRPEVLATRKQPLDPVQNSPGTFDDKMVVVDASNRGVKRGDALPLLLDLDRKHMFLHDASVQGLNSLFDPQRGGNAPHPFYLKQEAQRDDLVQFLRGLDTERR